MIRESIGKKIIVIGCPGSGKSYFSRELSKILNIDVYHLDMIKWKENWESISRNEFDEILLNVLNKDSWIIDGNYQRILPLRLKYAEIVFFLELPTATCLKNEKQRRGKPRPDLPSFLKEDKDPEFVEYIKNFK